MCDYSLFEHPNRLAAEGEDLVTYRFCSRSLGLVSAGELACAKNARVPAVNGRSILARLKQRLSEAPRPVAVCVPHGSRLRFEDTPESARTRCGVAEAEEVTFVQLTAAANVHRDAIQFRDGRQMLLQLLPEGVTMRVISIGEGSDADLGSPVSSEAHSIVFVGRSF